MPDRQCIAGVVLAGGRSSRMGRDKALLDYNGVPLIDHMISLLEQAGLENIYISGDYEGYDCLPDSRPFAGPAAAIRDVLDRLSDYDSVLFVPVDMPFLTQTILRALLKYESGAHYKDWPLPLCLPTAWQTGQGDAVKAMLCAMDVAVLPLPQDWQDHFANLNTPGEWEKAVRR